jgi:hypothetical protein
MRGFSRTLRALPFLGFMWLSGCSAVGAPSFVVFGAFFPAWMLCGSIGIIGAIVARAVFVGTGLANVVPHPLLVCTAIGTISATAGWLLCFGW